LELKISRWSLWRVPFSMVDYRRSEGHTASIFKCQGIIQKKQPSRSKQQGEWTARRKLCLDSALERNPEKTNRENRIVPSTGSDYGYRHIGVTRCLYLWNKRASITMVITYEIIWCHNLKDHNPNLLPINCIAYYHRIGRPSWVGNASRRRARISALRWSILSVHGFLRNFMQMPELYIKLQQACPSTFFPICYSLNIGSLDAM
jgi:hypothetical protein